MKNVLIASDHAGYEVKEGIKKLLDRLKICYVDLGSDSEASVDYPDFAARLAGQIGQGEAEFGILVCGTGIGMQIAANKLTGVRAALAWNEETARLARQHNNANVLTVGSRTTPAATIERIVEIFLTTSFEGGRHQQRLDKISELERR